MSPELKDLTRRIDAAKAKYGMGRSKWRADETKRRRMQENRRALLKAGDGMRSMASAADQAAQAADRLTQAYADFSAMRSNLITVFPPLKDNRK